MSEETKSEESNNLAHTRGSDNRDKENPATQGKPPTTALKLFLIPEIEAFENQDKVLIPRLQQLAERYLTHYYSEKFSALVLERLPRESRYTHRVAVIRDTHIDRKELAAHLNSSTFRLLFQNIEPMWFDILSRAVFPEKKNGTSFAVPPPDFQEHFASDSGAKRTKDEDVTDSFGYLNQRIDLTDIEQYKYFRSKAFTDLLPEEQLIYLLQDFVHSSNSDLHLQVNKVSGRASYRNCGDLEEKFKDIPPKQYRALSFGLCTAGRQDAQDMRRRDVDSVIQVRALVDNTPTDISLRFNSQPADYGASITIRLQKEPIRDISKIGFSPVYHLDAIYNALSQPHGIISTSGATGSGKTNTLESFFSILEQPRTKKIIEIASPIEIESLYRTQISVSKTGFTARKALESSLRADPDVLCVGEARDREYLELALEGALTGHLVMMTYHGSNVEATLSRFLTMGIERTQIASALNMMVSQTLVKTICPHCRKIDEHASRNLDFKVYLGTGCSKCFYTGVGGRTAIAEVLLVDDFIKDLVEGSLSPSKIVQKAISSGRLVPMHDHAKEKILDGTITYMQAALALGRRRQNQPVEEDTGKPAGEDSDDQSYDVSVSPIIEADVDYSEGKNYDSGN